VDFEFLHHVLRLATLSDLAIAGLGLLTAIGGAAAGAFATGAMKLRTDREEGTNKWLQFKRGNARGFLEHVAVHCRDDEPDEADVRLIGHYYTLALAVSDDSGAKALYEGLPDRIKQRVHDPGESPMRELRAEVTPSRRALAP
jgi:hypothetical protein